MGKVGACGKVRHPNRRRAIGAAIRLSRRTGTPLRVYPCARCGGFHLTSWRTPKGDR
jgi:hypothetical protein